MAPFKRRVFRVAVFLVFAAIIMTLLSSTIYRLTWPQVSTASITDGKLDMIIKYTTIAIPSREDIGDMGLEDATEESRAATMNLRRGAYLSLPFDQMSTLDRYNISAMASVSSEQSIVAGSVVAYVTYVDSVYNNATGEFDVYFIIDPMGQTPVGYPLTITFTPKAEAEYNSLVPLGSVFIEENSGYYIYAITEKQTIWGKTNYVEKIAVEILRTDYQYAAIAFDTSLAPELIACNPTRTLRSGEPVVVKGSI